MNAGGWITMLVSLAFVWGLALWCYRKVLGRPGDSRPRNGGEGGGTVG